MSQYTIQVDQFLLNKLQPEIDKLNLSLISMEERGYDSTPMRNTRNKLNKLIVIYDYLKEYAYGDEEVELEDLRDIMKIVGAYNTTNKTHTSILQSTRDSLDINESGGCLDFIRVYINDEILKTSVISPLSEYTTFKIYASDSVNSISVDITVTGANAVTYIGTNYVTIPNIQLDEIEAIILDITTVNDCGETTVKSISYEIKDISCSASTYWIGGTIERFSISDSDLNESTDIAINPNSGTLVLPVELDYNWIDTSDEMLEYLYREDVVQTFTINDLDTHGLLLIPTALEVTDVNELVAGSPVDMTEGLHYDTFPITSPDLKQYNCIYFRDLTSLTSTEDRTIQFTINKI